jgi:hypothetical protein
MLFALLAGALSATAGAAALAPPTDRVILTVSGHIGQTNQAQEAVFDRAMLESLPQHKIETSTPWTEGTNTFEGPLLKDLLAALDAEGETLDAIALNDYKISIPVKDADDYPVILALKMNGKNLRVRTKGPLWVIYPWSSDPSLDEQTYYSRSIWQLNRLVVH